MRHLLSTVALLLFVSVSLFPAAACRRQPDVDRVEVGQDVAITKANGGVVEGKVVGTDDQSVHLTSGAATTSIAKGDIVDVAVAENAAAVVLPPAARFREYTVPAGTTLSLKLVTPISTATSRPEDAVEASLSEAVTIDGAEVLPAGSIVKGVVSAVQASAKVKGLASITVHFSSLAAAGHEARYDIDATYAKRAEPTKKEDATKIGIGAGAGAAIGGLLGGKGGAAKGALIGGGAGTAVVLSTAGREVERPAGALLTTTLKKSVDVRVSIK